MIRRVNYRGNMIEYELRQTARKSVECRVAPGKVTVFAPVRFPLRGADDFVLRQGEWILKTLQASNARAEEALERSKQAMREGASVPVEGRNYEIRLDPGGRPSVRAEGEKLIVSGTDGETLSVRAAVRAYLMALAETRFEERVRFHAGRIGVHPNSITLREQKTKWGSCSSLGNLNFNWKLVMAPPEALDYVVVHELCHLLEMNHSPAFWAQVEKHCPDYRRWRDCLKRGISSPFD